MSAIPDYYRILHVQPDAPTAVIHASFRSLSQRLQASTLSGGSDAALLEEAYAVLGDTRRRAAYDQLRSSDPTANARPSGSRTAFDQTDVLGTNACLFCGTPHGLQRVIERGDDCGRCDSPLFPAERHRFEYSGQRMLSRMPKQRGIHLYVTWPQPEPFAAQMRDISLNGMQFVAVMQLHPNQIVKIDCQELGALGRVAHTAPDPDNIVGWSTGVEFLTLRFRKSRGSFVSARV
jgi:hypothetical protein